MPYETAPVSGPLSYALQNMTTKRVVALFADKNMATDFVFKLNNGQVSYFTDVYTLREIVKGEDVAVLEAERLGVKPF